MKDKHRNIKNAALNVDPLKYLLSKLQKENHAQYREPQQ
jgi:hypothetical protein